jgi:hypothetical protein
MMISALASIGCFTCGGKTSVDDETWREGSSDATGGTGAAEGAPGGGRGSGATGSAATGSGATGSGDAENPWPYTDALSGDDLVGSCRSGRYLDDYPLLEHCQEDFNTETVDSLASWCVGYHPDDEWTEWRWSEGCTQPYRLRAICVRENIGRIDYHYRFSIHLPLRLEDTCDDVGGTRIDVDSL